MRLIEYDMVLLRLRKPHLVYISLETAIEFRNWRILLVMTKQSPIFRYANMIIRPTRSTRWSWKIELHPRHDYVVDESESRGVAQCSVDQEFGGDLLVAVSRSSVPILGLCDLIGSCSEVKIHL